MNRFEAYCRQHLHHTPMDMARAREAQCQAAVVAELRVFFGQTAANLPTTAVSVAKATPMSQPEVFWVLVAVLRWILRSPTRLRDLNAATMIERACEVLKDAQPRQGPMTLNAWLRSMEEI